MFLCSKLCPPLPLGRASFYIWSITSTNLVDVHEEMLHNKYQKLYTFQFQRRQILKFSFFVPMLDHVTPIPQGRDSFTVLTPGVSLNKFGRAHNEMLHTKYQSSTLPAPEKKNSDDFLLCSYVLTCDPTSPTQGDGASFDPRGII